MTLKTRGAEFLGVRYPMVQCGTIVRERPAGMVAI